MFRCSVGVYVSVQLADASSSSTGEHVFLLSRETCFLFKEGTSPLVDRNEFALEEQKGCCLFLSNLVREFEFSCVLGPGTLLTNSGSNLLSICRIEL